METNAKKMVGKQVVRCLAKGGPRVDFTQKSGGDKLKVKITPRMRKMVIFAKIPIFSVTQPCHLRSFESCSDCFAGLTFLAKRLTKG